MWLRLRDHFAPPSQLPPGSPVACYLGLVRTEGANKGHNAPGSSASGGRRPVEDFNFKNLAVKTAQEGGRCVKFFKHVSSLLLVLAVVIASTSTVYANSVFAGGNVTVGMREVVRNAGTDGNYNIEVYRTDGRFPNAEDKARGPAFTQEGNQIEPAVVKRIAGDPNGHWWAVIDFRPVNTGEIVGETVECAAVELPYSEVLGGYVVDLSKVPPGKFFVGLTVRHLGGENVMQIVIFVIRTRREVKDQAGFCSQFMTPFGPIILLKWQQARICAGLNL